MKDKKILEMEDLMVDLLKWQASILILLTTDKCRIYRRLPAVNMTISLFRLNMANLIWSIYSIHLFRKKINSKKFEGMCLWIWKNYLKTIVFRWAGHQKQKKFRSKKCFRKEKTWPHSSLNLKILKTISKKLRQNNGIWQN